MPSKNHPKRTEINGTKTDDKQDETDQATQDYYAKIKSLNESVSKWIKTHVEVDQCAI